MRRLLFLLAAALGGCAPVLRPLTATDAASGLEQVTFSKRNELDPAISPDGKELAYDAAAAPDGAPHVEVLSLADRKLVYASRDGSQPTWMPDASSIVFAEGSSGRSRLVETYGQGVRPVFLADVGDPAFGGTQPVVSPDGKLVVLSLDDVAVRRSEWSSARRFDHALGVTDFLGTGMKIVGRGLDPAISPDGRHIAYVKNVQGREHVFLADLNGSNATQLTFGADDDESPAFSPGGRRVAFCSVDGDPPLRSANLFVVRTDGSDLVQLTEGDRVACHPSWAKDGFLYFHADARSRFHVFRLRPAG